MEERLIVFKNKTKQTSKLKETKVKNVLLDWEEEML
jgi:hypothetical protein